MVVKRRWRVVSGTMAAGVVLVPAANAFAGDGIAALEDSVPLVEDFSFSAAEKEFLGQLFEGQPVNLDFLSISVASASIASESLPSEPTPESESLPSEPTPESESLPSEPTPESESLPSLSGESIDD